MKVILAVLKDLYKFAVTYRFGFVTAAGYTIPVQDVHTTDENTSNTFPALSPFSPLTPEPVVQVDVHESQQIQFEGVGYVYTPQAFLFALPTRMFDGVVARLPYGTSFQILNSQGKWAHILVDDIKGWIHLDDVTESNADLNPKFSVGDEYDSEHESTIKLRTRIDDEFHATMFSLPLQDVEYVIYKLLRKGREIEWPRERPRVAGTWQRLLKGVLGVHMGVHPKTDTLMEYINKDNTGHVAYIESVYPDGSISVSEIGYPTEGKYNERTLSKDEWKELRPIFIEVA